jgi:replicative DNA helicase
VDYFAIQTCIEKATQFQYDPSATIRPAVDIATRLQRYAIDARTNKGGVMFDLKVIDEVICGLRGGEVMVIISNPGCFKTTTLMNLLYRGTISRTEGVGVFFSLEMQIEAETEREIRMMMRPDEPWTIRRHAQDNSKYWQGLERDVADSQANRIYVSDENGLTVEKMMKVIKNTEECYGQKVSLVGIDYLDFVEAKSTKEYEAVKEVMIQIKRNMAKQLNLPVIVLAQTSRENKDSEEEVGARSGKGGTPIEATSDFLIGLWRDGERIIGRFSKHRRTEYKVEYPYFSIELDKKNYAVNGVCPCDKPKKKRNKKFEEE